MADNEVRQLVRDRYGQEARRVLSGAAASGKGDAVSGDLYGEADAGAVPAEALKASLGCGNPAALAKLEPGEVVLDLGSGGGIDVLLSARRVGPSGQAYGLDMTDEMLALAEQNIVIRGPIPAGLRQDARLWAGCFAGALTESDYRAKLQAAGFTGIEVQATRVYGGEEAREFLASQGADADRLAPQVAGKVISAFVRAVKP